MAIVKVSEWAKQHGWSPQYANRRVKECGIPRDVQGRIDSTVADAMHAGEPLPVAVVALTQMVKTETIQVARAVPADLEGLAKADLERLEIIENLRKKRLANDENEGQLLRRNDVQKEWEAHRDAVKNRLLLLEAKVPSDSRQIVGREVRAALHELAEPEVHAQ
jgi:hypothetical protein